MECEWVQCLGWDVDKSVSGWSSVGRLRQRALLFSASGLRKSIRPIGLTRTRSESLKLLFPCPGWPLADRPRQPWLYTHEDPLAIRSRSRRASKQQSLIKRRLRFATGSSTRCDTARPGPVRWSILTFRAQLPSMPSEVSTATPAPDVSGGEPQWTKTGGPIDGLCSVWWRCSGHCT